MFEAQHIFAFQVELQLPPVEARSLPIDIEWSGHERGQDVFEAIERQITSLLSLEEVHIKGIGGTIGVVFTTFAFCLHNNWKPKASATENKVAMPDGKAASSES